MTIQRQRRRFAKRLDQRRANREIRHEVTIHDVNMDHTSAALRRPPDLIRKMREVSRKYRGCQLNQTWISPGNRVWRKELILKILPCERE